MSEVEYNEHYCDDKPQYEDGYCNYCGEKEGNVQNINVGLNKKE